MSLNPASQAATFRCAWGLGSETSMMSLLFILFLAVIILPLANREKLSIILFCEWIRFDALYTGKIMRFSYRLILGASMRLA